MQHGSLAVQHLIKLCRNLSEHGLPLQVGLHFLMPAGFLWLYTTMLAARSKRLRAAKVPCKAA